MTENKINILCSIDDNYVPFCGIMLTSLFETNLKENFEVYLFTEKLKDENIKMLQRMITDYGNHLNICYIDENVVKNFPIKGSDHVSLATYYRLFAPALLPKDVDKVIYLDCDMIVNGSISALWNEDVSEYALRAVDDESGNEISKFNRLNYPAQRGYFCAGMLLINLDYWRKHNVMERCLQYISDFPERLLFHDQDVLNAVLNEEKGALPLKYNFQTAFLYNYGRDAFSSVINGEIIKTISESPAIIHYTGPYKPWFPHSNHPYANYFLYYKKISYWNKLLPKYKVSIKGEVRRILNSIIWILGIKPRPRTYIIPKQKFRV